jgi:hypothetical protein
MAPKGIRNNGVETSPFRETPGGTAPAGVLNPMEIRITLDEVMGRISSPASARLRPRAEAVLGSVSGLWRPRAAWTWLDIAWTRGSTAALFQEGSGRRIVLDLGFSIRFLSPALKAMAAVYTAGEELESAARRESSAGNHLEAYLVDLIGLILLDRVADRVKAVAETLARERGWGVGPFLSPGSVHGWELQDQASLCSLVPLREIGVEVRSDHVLAPFKSLSCLLPIGPGYSEERVGSTCRVCSLRASCRMRQEGPPAGD